MKILSKSNYRVRLNVNMDIVDSISFSFNFGEGHYFVLRLKQHFFDKALATYWSFVTMDLSYPDDWYPSTFDQFVPTLWSIRNQQIMTQNV